MIFIKRLWGNIVKSTRPYHKQCGKWKDILLSSVILLTPSYCVSVLCPIVFEKQKKKYCFWWEVLGIKTAKCLTWQRARFSLKGAGTNTSALFPSMVNHWSLETNPLATMRGLSHLLELKERHRKSSKTHKKAIKHFKGWCESSSAHTTSRDTEGGFTDWDPRTARKGTVTALCHSSPVPKRIDEAERGTLTRTGLLNGWWLMADDWDWH